MKKSLLCFYFFGLMLIGGLPAQPFSITASTPYMGATASGEYRIYRTSFNNNISLSNLNKPLIFVEGFDPNDDFTIPGIYNILDAGFNSAADQLHAAGYDIIILNFDDGGDFIQRNAFLLVELINQANAQKPNNEELVVVGFSMGGLVARYALTYMEEQNIDHETRLYVSFDSPHKGAHVPAGIQALATTFDSPTYQQLFPDLEESLNQFFAPAAQQMLKFRLTSPTTTTGELPLSSDHLDFLDDLETQNNCNGFPTQTRNIGIALGSWNSIPQRSNLDLDNDMVNDFQHSGFPMLYINFPQGDDDSDVQAIWELNTCESVAAFGFQAFLSTAWSTNYPYFSDRSSYGGLGNWIYATYWYRNSFGLPILPLGAWSRVWSYEGDEPTDFAPGSFVPAYDDLLDALNSQVDCSFSYADNSTFVPTVSAFAFDTDDVFYDILADGTRIDKTPFDAIIGVTGDNRSHRANQTGNATIVNFLINEITNTSLGTTCATALETLTGTVNNGQTVTVDEVDRIEGNNYTINSGATVDLEANTSITFTNGFVVNDGATFHAEIVPCSPKTCVWEATNGFQSPPSGGVSFFNQAGELLNYETNEQPRVLTPGETTPPTPEALPQPKPEIATQAYPNPTDGDLIIYAQVEQADIRIIDALGQVVYTGQVQYGENVIQLDVPSGVYQLILTDKNQQVYQEKIVKH